ncbi:Ribosome biogenesis protein BOP1, partial [Daphnia magna]
TASKSAKRRYEIVENKGNSEDVDDIIEAQVSDNADDSTDEESSEYSGLEDDEEDDSGDEEDESAWEEANDSEEKVAPTAIPIEQVGSSAPVEEPARPVEDEYAYDSSDEEDLRNTVGNIPMNWYNEYPHIGYDLEGKPILKPKRGDEIDN